MLDTLTIQCFLALIQRLQKILGVRRYANIIDEIMDAIAKPV